MIPVLRVVEGCAEGRRRNWTRRGRRNVAAMHLFESFSNYKIIIRMMLRGLVRESVRRGKGGRDNAAGRRGGAEGCTLRGGRAAGREVTVRGVRVAAVSLEFSYLGIGQGGTRGGEGERKRGSARGRRRRRERGAWEEGRRGRKNEGARRERQGARAGRGGTRGKGRVEVGRAKKTKEERPAGAGKRGLWLKEGRRGGEDARNRTGREARRTGGITEGHGGGGRGDGGG